MTTSSPALAVIDGKLCRLSRTGSITSVHAPLATAVMEFRQGPMRLYVREHPFGLLPGMSNLYCLDGNFGLLWLAQWPYAEDPCGRLGDESGDILTTESVAGLCVRLDAATGRVVECQPRVAAAS